MSRVKHKPVKAATKATVKCYVHELVAQTFVENPNNYPYIEHIDGNISNNHADNLRWTSVKPKGKPNYLWVRLRPNDDVAPDEKANAVFKLEK